MKKYEKAILLSVLVFPGAGHVFLKRYLTGISLIIIAMIASYFLIFGVIDQALEIADKIRNGEIYPDLSVILELVSHQSGSTKFQSINIATMTLLATWLVGIVDSYRIGWQQNKATEVKNKSI